MDLANLIGDMLVHIEEGGLAPALEAYIAAAKQGDTDDAWAALTTEEQHIIQVAYSRVTRLETAA